MAPCIRPYMAVAQTTLSNGNERLPFHGLFATRPLPAGGFIGFYNGVFKEGAYRGRDSYTMSTSDGYIRPSRHKGGIDQRRYPVAMINEPAAGT